MPRPEGRKRAAPLFDECSFNGLSQRTGYSLPCLYEAAVGRTPASKRSRFVAAAILRRTGAELFGEPQPEGE